MFFGEQLALVCLCYPSDWESSWFGQMEMTQRWNHVSEPSSEVLRQNHTPCPWGLDPDLPLEVDAVWGKSALILLPAACALWVSGVSLRACGSWSWTWCWEARHSPDAVVLLMSNTLQQSNRIISLYILASWDLLEIALGHLHLFTRFELVRLGNFTVVFHTMSLPAFGSMACSKVRWELPFRSS